MDTDPLWTARSLVDNAEAVRRVHRDFLTAGARIVLTCSYQVSGDLFKEELGLSRAQTREHIGRDEQRHLSTFWLRQELNECWLRSSIYSLSTLEARSEIIRQKA